MQWTRGRWLVAIGGATAIVGCAVGSSSDEATTNDLATSPVEAGTDEASVKLQPPPPPPPEDAGGGASADGGGGALDGGGSGGGGGGGGGTSSCAASSPCAASTSLGTVSGDTGSDSQSHQGTTSAWLTVRVTENDNGVFGNPLKLKSVLVSPPGEAFDLFVYVPGSDALECSAVTKSAPSVGGTATASVEFGEMGTFANGVDDSRTVTVEVRHASGSCSPSAKWTLTVFGNQH